jgi:molybdopterin synthase sulfur carrier subunit
MKVRVLYFASLRDRLGRSADELDLPADIVTIDQVRAYLVSRGDPWQTAFSETRRVRAAVNRAMADGSTRIGEGAEIAFFPPVTGG